MAAEAAAAAGGEGRRSSAGGLLEPETGAPGPQRPDEEAAEAAAAAAQAPGAEERECRVCYNAFDAEARAPKMLECLHTFCLACLQQMLRHQALSGGGGAPLAAAVAAAASSLACPLCRHRTALLSEERLRLLPLNTKLLPPPPLPPARLQLLPLAQAAPRPFLQRPLPVPGGPAVAAAAASPACYALEPSRSQEVRTVRCVCVVFTFFSLMVISITGPLFLNYSGWVELFMVSLFLVVAIVLALFSVVPYFLHSHRYRAGGRRQAGSGAPLAGSAAAATLGRIVLAGRS